MEVLESQYIENLLSMKEDKINFEIDQDIRFDFMEVEEW